MKTRIVMTMIILVIFSGGLVTAQEDDIPPQPDPEEIFAEGIVAEVVNSPALQEQANAPIQPNATFDNETRLLTIADSSFPYPQEISHIVYSRPPNEMVYTFTVFEFNDETEAVQQWVWYFDLETETFIRFESPCPLQPPLLTYDAEQVWVIIDDESGQFLCELATGNFVELAADYHWFRNHEFERASNVSPDGEWLLLFATEEDQSDDVFVFSFEFSTQEFHLLGELPFQEFLFVSQWVGSDVFIGVSHMPEWSTRNLYIADVTQAESLEWATGRVRFWPEYYDDPPRYEFVSGTEGAIGPCTWIIYDIETRQTTSYDLDRMCYPIIGQLNETAYYLNVPDSYDHATLVRFNAITGEREDLYTDEIEDVLRVSPNGRYAAFILDKNGRIDVRVNMPNHSQSRISQPYIAYVDLVTDEILFEFPVGLEDGDLFDVRPRGELRQIDDETFIALTNTVVGYSDEFAFSVANLFIREHGVYVEEFLVDNAIQILDNQRILIAPQGSLSEGIEIFDIETRTSQPFIRPFDGTRYAISFSRYNTSRIILSLGTHYDAPRVVYEVDLP